MTLKEILGDEYKEGMTVEEIEAAVAKSKKVVSKNDFDKKTSELVNTQKQLKEKLTEQERQALEKEQADNELREKYEALLKQTTIAEHTNGLIGIGYEEVQAKSIATAFSEGNFDKVISELKSHRKSLEKTITKQLLENSPRPNRDEGTKEPSKKAIKDMSLDELQNLKTKNPEEFNELTK